jgi:transposase
MATAKKMIFIGWLLLTWIAGCIPFDMLQSLRNNTDVTQIRSMLGEMIYDGRSDEALDLVVDIIEAMREKNSLLQVRLMKLLRDKYGRRSEGVSSDQLSLLISHLEDCTETTEDDLKDIEEEWLSPPAPKEKKKQKGHGRRPLPDELEREEVELDVPTDDRTCNICGREKVVIGHEKSEVLEFQPARFKVLQYKRLKRACQKCGDGVIVAPVPNKVIERGLPGSGMLAEMLVSKYQDGLPLHRQWQRFKRLGVDIPRSTLCGWNHAVTDLLHPIVKAERKLVLSSFLLGADGTHIKVLDREHPANIKRGSLWCYVGDSQHICFDYVPNERKEGPQGFLWEREGYIQADADPKLDGLFKNNSRAIEVGCWMHARRPYAKALDVGDLRAAYPLKLIKIVYKVEAVAKIQRASPDRIKQLRQSVSKKVLNRLFAWATNQYQTERPKSPLGKALVYTIRQWKPLTRYLKDGRLPIDNGGVERAIRVVAVGRRNYLFVGSDGGGVRAAIAYTVLGNCMNAGVNPWAYLKDVLEKISDGWPRDDIEELLPTNWAKAHPEHCHASLRPDDA